jgi:hypothetical protein
MSSAKLTAFEAALAENGALRSMLNANSNESNTTASVSSAGGNDALSSALSELSGACAVAQSESTKLSMMFNPKATSINDANLLVLLDRFERAVVGCVIVTARVAHNSAQANRALALLCTTRATLLLNAVRSYVEQVAAILRAAPPVAAMDVRVVASVWSACDQLSAVASANANRDACLLAVQSIATLLQDARADLKDMIEVEAAADDDDSGGLGDDDDDDDDDDDEDDFESDAMSADELARAKRADVAMVCGGILVFQAQWLVQQESAGIDVHNAVLAAFDGFNARVDSLTASLCPPQDAAAVASETASLVDQCTRVGDLLLREAEKWGAPGESAARTIRMAVAKLRADSS